MTRKTPESAPAPREVARRVAPVPGLDAAYAHCLGCGRHVGGREDDGFSSHGTHARVEERARAHTAETGHPTRMYGGREKVTEFYPAWRRDP
jgi:hypothetical protein